MIRIFFAVIACLSASAHADTFRWIEAEKPIVTNFPASNPFMPLNDDEKSKLSGGAWIGASGKRAAPLFAVYDVEVPKAGAYHFYARKFWKHGPYRVSFNGGPWTSVGDNVPLMDESELRQFIVANWTRAGDVTLKAGKNRFRIESTTNDGGIAFDCFLITDGPFTARGLTRPDEKLKSDEAGYFAWDPPADRAGSPIDLRSLNGKSAGDDGRIIARGGQFIHEKTGKPVRFWGVNCGPDIVRLAEPDLDRFAALLASRGVNQVRLHGPIYMSTGKNAGEIDAAQLANVQCAVRVFKRNGIYSTLSIYYPLWLELDESNGWPGYKKQTPFALLYFNDKLQAIYRGWWKSLLTTPDPASGVALKDEPAVLSMELVNEDSLFFWTFQPRKTIPAPYCAPLEKRFGDWLAKRYGTLPAAFAKWGAGGKVEGDAVTEGRVGFLDLYSVFTNRDSIRSRDTAKFLYEVERDFYTATRAYLRDDLGAKSLVSGSNWITANDPILMPLERDANLAGDFIDRHGYYGGLHEGPCSSFAVNAGDTFGDRSALRFDPEKPGEKPTAANPILDATFNDRPTMLGEVDWTEPNRFRAEMPLLSAAYGAQQGLDAITFFAAPTGTWQPTISKFSTMSPVTLAQYPAAAMIYRLGLIDEAPTIVNATLNRGELLDLGGGVSGVDTKARFVGKYAIAIGDGPTSRPSVDVSRSIDEAAKTIRSASGQLTLDYGRGVLVIDAPRAKALAGFLSALGEGRSLGGVTIQSPMEYGTIAVVALDERPIASSKKLLVQVMSEQHNAGFKTSGDGVKKIDALGHTPILVREFAGTIKFNDGAKWKAQPLDQNGQPLGDALPVSATLELNPTVVHYLLTR